MLLPKSMTQLSASVPVLLILSSVEPGDDSELDSDGLSISSGFELATSDLTLSS